METRIIITLIIFNLLSSSLCGGINYLTFNTTNTNFDQADVPLSPELQKDVDYFNYIIERKARFACLIQLRNLLAHGTANTSAISDLYTTIRESKFERTLTFNKVIAMMAVNCKKQLNKEIVEDILTPEKTVLLHPNFTTFLYYDKSYFNTTQEITFTSEEEKYLLEIFDDYNKSDNQQQSNNTSKKSSSEVSEFSELVTKDYFLLGMAITRPYVLKYIGIGFGVTTIFLIFVSWIICSCFLKENNDLEETVTLKKKKN